MKIAFIPFSAEHMDLFLGWLKQPHVKEFWTESENELEVREKFLGKLRSRGVESFIIQIDDQCIGYIQAYEADKIGGGWWPNASAGTYGIDQFIGNPALIGKGIGIQVVRSFVQRLIADKGAKTIIADPDPKNARAIRLYQKLGFISKGIIDTPNGKAELMQLTSQSQYSEPLF
jgi:RimJ/RimL family protein N-acetyltransferase